MRVPAWRIWGTALALSWLAGCEAPLQMPASYYRVEEPPPALVLTFWPQRASPPAEAAALRALGERLPERALAVLYAAGPLAPQRARTVGRLLQRPVSLQPPPASPPLPPDLAVLEVRTAAGIVPDACRGPGGRGVEDAWPGDDADRGLLLPPGCAVAASLQAQVMRPSDLLVGRPLPPGAATPFAAAIERYYRRNDSSAAGSQPAASSGGGAPGSAGSETAANPLLGPLPQPRQDQAQAAPAAGSPAQTP